MNNELRLSAFVVSSPTVSRFNLEKLPSAPCRAHMKSNASKISGEALSQRSRVTIEMQMLRRFWPRSFAWASARGIPFLDARHELEIKLLGKQVCAGFPGVVPVCRRRASGRGYDLSGEIDLSRCNHLQADYERFFRQAAIVRHGDQRYSIEGTADLDRAVPR